MRNFEKKVFFQKIFENNTFLNHKISAKDCNFKKVGFSPYFHLKFLYIYYTRKRVRYCIVTELQYPVRRKASPTNEFRDDTVNNNPIFIRIFARFTQNDVILHHNLSVSKFFSLMLINN